MPQDEDVSQPVWERAEYAPRTQPPMNLAPLKGVLEADPVRSRVLRLLIEDGGWVSTSDLLRVARQVRSIVGAVTVGTILNGMNELVSSRLIISRTSLTSGFEWAEWRINPDLLDPTRKLLQMVSRSRAQAEQQADRATTSRRILEPDTLLNSE